MPFWVCDCDESIALCQDDQRYLLDCYADFTKELDLAEDSDQRELQSSPSGLIGADLDNSAPLRQKPLANEEDRAQQEKRVAPDGKRYTRREFIEYYGPVVGSNYWTDAKRACTYCATFKLVDNEFHNYPSMCATFGADRAKVLWKNSRPQLPRNMTEVAELYQRIPSECDHDNQQCPYRSCDGPRCLHFQHDFCSRGDKCPLCHCIDDYPLRGSNSSIPFGRARNQGERTGLMIALQEALAGKNSGYVRVSELIAAQADVNETYHSPNLGLQSPLTMAVLSNQARLTTMLCRAKADVACRVGESPSPIRLAHGRRMVGSLEAMACFPECYRAEDLTPEIVRLLVRVQTDINWADQSGQTALHCHAAAGRFEAVSLLVQHKARIDIRDTGGNAPIHLVPEMAEERAQWQSLLGFVVLASLSGEEMALPISELNLQQDFVHCVRQYLREYYQLQGQSVSYFTIHMTDGVSGHADK